MNTLYILALTAALGAVYTVLAVCAHVFLLLVVWAVVRRCLPPLRCLIIWLDDQERVRIAIARRKALTKVYEAWKAEDDARDAMMDADEKEHFEIHRRSLRQATVIRERREKQLLREVDTQIKEEN